MNNNVNINGYEQALIDWFFDHEQAAADVLQYCNVPDIKYIFDPRDEDRKQFDADFEENLKSTASELSTMDYEAICEYLSDMLDYSITHDSSGDYESAKVWLTVGGPGVYIDTADAYLKGRWGYTSIDVPIPYQTRDMIDDYMYELEQAGNCY